MFFGHKRQAKVWRLSPGNSFILPIPFQIWNIFNNINNNINYYVMLNYVVSHMRLELHLFLRMMEKDVTFMIHS